MAKRKNVWHTYLADMTPAQRKSLRASIRRMVEQYGKKIVLAGGQRVHEPTDGGPKNAA